ncbi:MAG: phage tail protein [Trichlorobacter sp.]|uniref:phage tail protein n=1 Tax=Trichlorobacter sp. TaxID=2911007 RepID=UPI00256448FA|nr:phage tail protein [Trichlorobacter sp.]MDK9716751.1 phage tail protein [Trichlorobacter sp.]
MAADTRLIPDAIRDVSTLALNELIDRMGTLDLTPLLVYLVDNVADSALLHLVEQFHVAGIEGGALAENATNRRTLIKNAIAIHRLKGTPAGIKRAIRDAGFGEVTIIERPGELFHDGTYTRNGLMTHGNGNGAWRNYHIIMHRLITVDQAVLIRALANEFAPVRCKLLQIVYTEAPLRHNGAGYHDGSYSRGAA